MRWRSSVPILVGPVTVDGMGKVFEGIDERLARWIAAQPMFFVGTAPLDPDGHVNVSPKGPIESLRVLGPCSVAYLDFVGSGAETVAHLRENGRIVIMLCAFAGPPRILRLHGRGLGGVGGRSRFRRAAAVVWLRDVAGGAGVAALDRGGRARPDRRFVRVRGPADELRGPARALRPVGGEEGAGGRSGRPARLPAGEELGRASTGCPRSTCRSRVTE